MNDVSGSTTRQGEWKCTACFMGMAARPTDDALGSFLPVDRIARLPSGQMACALVVCRAVDVDPVKHTMGVEVRVVVPVQHIVLLGWVEDTLMRTVERAFNATSGAGLPPIDGSEVLIASYFLRSVGETPEALATNTAVQVNVYFDHFAQEKRTRRKREADSQPLPVTATPLAFWRRWPWLSALLDLWVTPPQAPTPPPERVDPWAARAAEFRQLLLDKAAQNAASLLRKSTIYDPDVAKFLQEQQGVDAAPSATMVAFREAVLNVTWENDPERMGPVSEILELEPLEEPPRALRTVGDHEVEFVPRSRWQ